MHDLYGDLPLEAQVSGEIDGGHATARNSRIYLISTVYETANHRIRI
jgi:hypothetical protein